MAKNDLIGGALWDAYSNKVSERMDNPTHLGVLTQKDADERGAKLIVADYGAESCGDAVRLYWLVDNDDRIIDAKFKSFGCGLLCTLALSAKQIMEPPREKQRDKEEARVPLWFQSPLPFTTQASEGHGF